MQSNDNKIIYRIPLQLAVSKTPLYIRVEFPPLYPSQAPFIQVLARVIHQDLHPQTKHYQGKMIREWGIHSTILNVMRQIHAEFNLNPPLPESVNQPQNQQQMLQQVQPQFNHIQPQNQNMQHLKLNSMNQQQEERISEQDAIKLQKMKSINKVEDKLKELVHPPTKQQFMNVLNNLSYDELKEMNENEQYLRDFMVERDEFLKFDKEVDGIADKAEIIANENIKKYDELQKAMDEHQKLINAYNIKKEKLVLGQRQIEDLKSKVHPREQAKEIEKEATSLSKQSEVIRKQFKDGSLNTKDFIDSYISSRIKYYEAEYIKQQLVAMGNNYQ
ncbi:UNKNOWN [Stylonychia lemnae]|uniref:VPS37 C-terminal domain-containing protein n=1 Tax=Stylonychia lemnae TaxID=5949 RepID=A0A078AUF1_STYLE|nr:UNKNOWN [Stylonychia lemnae]|eukprot:CDW85849.1 UNKNOWN [Stylonychia lemnae]